MSVNFELLTQSHVKLCIFKVQKSDASIRLAPFSKSSHTDNYSYNNVFEGNSKFLQILQTICKYFIPTKTNCTHHIMYLATYI